MSFDDYELSTESGQPIELYELRVGSSQFFYTNNQVAVTISSREYRPLAIKRNRIALSVEGQKVERLNVSLPGDNIFVRKFVSIAPGQRPTCTVKRYHRVDTASQIIVEYRGVVQSVQFTENCNVAMLSVAALTAANSRPMPRLTYQGLCGHMLYDRRCKISEHDPDFEKFLFVSAQFGRVLTVEGSDAWLPDYFVNGFIEYDEDFRMVTQQDGEDLTLLLPFGTSPVGQTVRILAGCKHRVSTDCDSKFNNVLNFGGFPFVPTKNPFVVGLD